MNKDTDFNIDFVPPIFFRIFTLIAGTFVLVITVSALMRPFESFIYSFLENLVNNLNRLGLIFEFVGLISVVPDFLETKNAEKWEKRLSTIGPKVDDNRITFKYLFSTLSLETVSQSNGVLGIVNQASRGLSFLLLNIIYFTLPTSLRETSDISTPFTSFLLIGYCWLLLELLNMVFRHQKSKLDLYVLKLIRAASFWFCGGVIFFIPFLLISIPFVSLLKWISRNTFKTVIGTISLPFILLGTVCQLIASFL